IALDENLQAALKQEVLAKKDEANIDIDLNPDLTRLNAAFIPGGPRFTLLPGRVSDAKNIWGRIQAVSVKAEGDITSDGSDITGNISYTFSIIYGFGFNDAHNPKREGASKDIFSAARELQLAGLAHPFPVSVTITVKIRPNAPFRFGPFTDVPGDPAAQ